MAERKPRALRPADAQLLRPARFDDLGLRRALGDRMLPSLVAAMSFLAALALAAAFGAAALAGRWQEGAASAVTIQVPQADAPLSRRSDGPEETRRDAVLRVLRASPDVARLHLLDGDELAELLRPWLGAAANGVALPLPAVIDVHLAEGGADLQRLARALDDAAPGTLTESHGLWVGRLSALARSLQACAWTALLVVALVAIAVVMVAARAGLAARRDAIEIVHGLGAADGYIAGRFARRITRLAALGGLIGAGAAFPVLLELTSLAAPFMHAEPATQTAGFPLAALSAGLPIWAVLPALPLAAGAIGFLTTQATVRSWLRKLP